MTAPELLSIVLRLEPITPLPDRTPPRWWGRAAHALLLRVVQQADPALARHLHDHPDAPRPFTVSSLLGPGIHRGLQPNATYNLRFTALNAQLAALLLEACTNGHLAPNSTVELDRFAFRVLPPSSENNPWQGQSTYKTLQAQSADASHSITLRLASPTTFKHGGHHLPFPLPATAFGGLLKRWQAFAPTFPLPDELAERLKANVVISRYRLQSAVVPLKGNSRRIGAVGVVTYTALDLNKAERIWFNTLAGFAFYAGLGAGVTMGLGQCRPVSAEEAYGNRTSHHTGSKSNT